MGHLVISMVGVAIATVCLTFVHNARPSKVHSTLYATLVMILFYFICNVWQETSASVAGWRLSMQFTYTVSTLVIYMLGITLFMLCGINMPRWLAATTTALAFFDIFIFMTLGVNDLYFKQITMTANPARGGLYVFTAVKGPMYTVANVVVILLTLLMVVPLLVRMNRLKGYSVVFMRITLLIGLLNPLFFAVSFLGLIPSMYTNALTDISLCVLLTYAQIKYDLVMSASVAKDISIDTMPEGLLILNLNNHLIYHNDQAEEILAECNWENPEQVSEFIRGNILGQKMVTLAGTPYEIRENEFKQSGILVGTTVWLVNTSEQTRMLLQEERTRRAEETLNQSVTVLAHAIDAKDRYTNGHSLRVAGYAKLLAERMGKDKEYVDSIFIRAILHDVGKIGVSDEIINKPGKLTAEEYDIIKTHPVKGYEILSGISSHPELAQAARWHHERFDGKGYPDGLKGTEIPEFARIIAVADAYDAMSSNRSYRRFMPQSEVAAEIRRCSGTQFDPDIAEVWLQVMAEDTKYELREQIAEDTPHAS